MNVLTIELHGDIFLNGTYYKQKRPETRGLLTKFQGVKETKHWR